MKRGRSLTKRAELADIILCIILTGWGLIVVVPFFNAVAISFTSYREYLETPLLLFPKKLDLNSYRDILLDPRIITGYRTSLTIIAIGVPLSLFLCASMGFALSRRKFPGKKFFLYAILFTMLFNGGIVPLYLVVRNLKLTNTLWSVILCSGMNTFYVMLMNNYFQSLPESLVESAKLDGAGEWTILLWIIIPLSMPMMATMILFFSVDKWNEYFNAMIFIRKTSLQPLQTILRSIIVDSATSSDTSIYVPMADRSFNMGVKMAAVIVTMLPIMCVYPFLQKHFTKGMMIGAIKA
jgi:putative aldouronate transport system permease protein